MILGVLSCAKKKLPVPAPAWLMYSASPRFSQQYQALRRRCDAILIISAKYGPVKPGQVISPYDLFIEQLDGFQKQELMAKCRKAIDEYHPELVISFLSSKYRDFIEGMAVEQLEGGLYETAAKIGKQGNMRRGRQKVCWPINCVLVEVASHKPTILQLVSFLRSQGYSKATIMAQLFRAKICPLHRLVNGRIENKYVSVSQAIHV